MSTLRIDADPTWFNSLRMLRHLVDFVIQDRYQVAPPKPPLRRTFRTPARDHRRAGGILVPGYGEAVWELPGGPFTYGRFRLQSPEYDVE